MDEREVAIEPPSESSLAEALRLRGWLLIRDYESCGCGMTHPYAMRILPGGVTRVFSSWKDLLERVNVILAKY